MLSLNRLALLVELARRGTIQDVATALSYSPSTVSQQLHVLEQELGVPLIERVGRGVRLTRQGDLLVAHGHALLLQAEAVEADVAASLHDARGTARLATFQTAALAVLPGLLGLIDAEHPGIRVDVGHIEPMALLGALAAREFDLGLGEEYPGRAVVRHPDIELRTMRRDPLVLVAPPSTPADATLADLVQRLPWVMEPQGYDAREWVMARCRAAGFEPDIRFESPDLLVHVRLVETGHAISVLPGLLLDAERPNVRRLPFGADDPTRHIFVAYRRGTDAAPHIAEVLGALDRVMTPQG